jgi:hypothetical protein
MAIKSAYREKTTPAPEIKIDGEPPAAAIGITTNDDEAVVAAIKAAADADAAKNHLKQLRQSEAYQKQQREAAMAAQRTLPTREQRLEQWKQQGLTDAEASWMRDRPALIDRPEVTQHAVAAALHSGLERGTDDFHTAVENNFNTIMAKIEAAAAAANPANQPTPEDDPARFSLETEPSPPELALTPDRSHIVSAPVSRDRAPGGYREQDPRHVRLSAAEQQIARASGISDVQYAANKLRMEREKRNGERQ